ncbi:type II toxin-antitoxin system prevent-host-death family antitoxin [Lentisphaera profundi]|uniref:Antitoxin n=1 Tax=Lentisphaera profundi TaxID=1658616 RepID=A0ABY7VP61_9BACT|nr:type II toxin-antitoxin system prevent-host-death family antitoxin [Lentisphaera profundi]WDE95940.1 type II toxin-antitoxin system prevent-host-death family antitoxin [Lentisphaera profundi]
MNVNIHEAKTQLSKLLKLCEQGEEIIIARKGEPIAKLSPLKTSRKLGFFDCDIDMKNFDDLIPGMEDYFVAEDQNEYPS